MLRLASVTLLVALGGCTLWFGEDKDNGDDDCLILPAEGTTGADIAPAEQRDPYDLTCDSYGGGGYPCNPECGPCPEATDVRGLEPPPTYPYCGHACETLNEAACAADSQCRVVKFADCVLNPAVDCFTDFLGCFPIDTAPDQTVDCWNADAWSCSRSSACSALHSAGDCEGGGECGQPFELCVPEGQNPGWCGGPVACDRLPPQCPVDSTPGILNGCYTGACIPGKYCYVD